jgi:preprotein translocase subunit SecA
MLLDLRERVTSVMMRVEISPQAPPPMPEPVRVLDMRHPDPNQAGGELEYADAGMAPPNYGTAAQAARAPIVAAAVDPNDPTSWGNTPRNAACPCGSGKKYKHCHGRV